MSTYSAGDAERAPRGLKLGQLGMRAAQLGVVGGALGVFAIQVRSRGLRGRSRGLRNPCILPVLCMALIWIIRLILGS